MKTRLKNLLLAAISLLLPTLFVVSSPELSNANENVLLICVDDLRPELKSFGVDHIHSPNIDALASRGRAFTRHYVNAPSCGPSRYTLLTGRYGPADNKALFKRAAAMKQSSGSLPASMPAWFRKNGYTTVSVGKVSHHPGGWGGKNWADRNDLEMPDGWSRTFMPVGGWNDPHTAMHGYANGKGRNRKTSKAYESIDGDDTIYPDGLIAEEGLAQLDRLAKSDKPFFLAIGLLKPHLPFGAPKRYMSHYEDAQLPPIPHPEKPDGKTTWHESAEFFRQYFHDGKDPREDPEYADLLRRHYAACVTYADKHVGDILARLKETGRDRDTIVVLWGDHGWHLGEHAIWGKHCLFEEALRSPLIIDMPEMKQRGAMTDSVVETLDIFPTLCELTKLPKPDFALGVSLVPQLNDPSAPGHSAFAYRNNSHTLRTDTHRIIVHRGGHVELYDHRTAARETLNVADSNPELVSQLRQIVDRKRQQIDRFDPKSKP